MAHLVVLKGPNLGHRLPLANPKTVLGREAGCDVVLDSSAGGNRKRAAVVSRKHAVLTLDQGQYYIEDGDGANPSRNHTFVNDAQVTFPGRTLLQNNDVIKICDFALLFDDGTDSDDLSESPSSIDAAISHDSSSVFLTQPAEKLALLIEISNRLSHTHELNDLLPLVVENLLQLFKQADRVFLILVDELTGGLIPQIIKTRRPKDEAKTAYSASIVKQCLKTVQGMLINDPPHQFPNSASVAVSTVKSVVCAPLWSQSGRAFGVLMLDSQHKRRRFSQEDLNLLMGVASQASIAMVNAKFLEDALARERLNRDLALAREVVRSFLPAGVPEIPSYEFYACNESALEVGGDYYDFLPLPGGRIGILLGDVAGKGVAAALVMARFSAEARLCLRTEPDAVAAVRQLNALMQPLILTDRFVTLATLVLDPAAHTVTMVNAGHPLPLLLRRATGTLQETIPKAGVGPPLGVLDGYPYEAHQITLEPGDTLTLFSDGVTEAMNIEGHQLGAQEMHTLIEQHRSSPRDLGDRILKTVKDHAAGCRQHDDITLVCFGRRG